MDEASRKQWSARRQACSVATTDLRTPPEIDDHGGVAVADVDLDRLLTDRGWVEFDRADGLTMYDWPPSAPDEDHEITYLILDLHSVAGVGPPYRVSVVNGDRLMYEVESALVADLDTIEATRCAGCVTRRKQRGSGLIGGVL